MRLPDLSAAYRRWRERRVYDSVRRELFWWTGDPAFLTMTDEEMNEAGRYMCEMVSQVGVSVQEASDALARAVMLSKAS